MRKRKMATGKITACILAMTLAISACGQNGAEDAGQTGTRQTGNGATVTTAQKAEEVTLTVYCLEGIPLFTKAIREYKQVYEIDVNLEIFEDVTEMEARITAEALSGGGPDVFLFSTDSNTLDVHKMMKNGSFYALDELMEQEKSYSGYQPEKYYDCMLEAGKYKGGQYVLPFSFNMMQFYADSELIDTNWSQLRDGYTMQELVQAIESECNLRCGEKESTGIIWDVRRGGINNIFLEQSQLPYIDYEMNQVTLNREMLEELFGFFRTFIQTEKTEEVVQKYTVPMDYFSHISFYAEDTSMLNAVRHNVSAYGMVQIKPYFYVLPAWDQADSYTAAICEYGAVNANSVYPEESYKLLRTIMDYQVPYDFNKYQPELNYYLPVNKDNLNSCMEMVKQQRGRGKFTIYPLRDEYGEYAVQLEGILANIIDAVIPNPKVGSIISEVMQPYFMGDEEFEACYTKLENRLKLYLSE